MIPIIKENEFNAEEENSKDFLIDSLQNQVYDLNQELIDLKFKNENLQKFKEDHLQGVEETLKPYSLPDVESSEGTLESFHQAYAKLEAENCELKSKIHQESNTKSLFNEMIINQNSHSDLELQIEILKNENKLLKFSEQRI